MDCPSHDDLERYVAGFADEVADAVNAHVEACATCREYVTEAQADDALLGELSALDEAVGESASTPSELGGYRIIRRIGEGGMGIVYEAEQKAPLRRVALKVMRPGFWSAAGRARFAREAELLGRLDHPGIARILEAGTFDVAGDPQPFFAMELVRGRTLDLTWPDGDARDRVRTVVAVCRAVQHAHQHGVVHRDLKPSNILVDEAGRPRVLDFGIARALDVEDAASATRTGQLVGTLPYMSPEQVSGDPRRVDTRADVYALGVILHEALAGRRPFDVAHVAPAEAARVIAEQAPPRLGQLVPECRGDLETIAGKALEKDPDRRYPSASALADDLERWLAYEPVLARPPRLGYVVSRFARRNPALATSMVAAVLLLVGGVIVTSWLLVRAQAAEADALEKKGRAELEARDALAARDWLQELLFLARPGEISGAKSLKEVVLEAAKRVDSDLEKHPVVRAAVHHTLGRVFHAWSDLPAARRHLKRALELYREVHGRRHSQVGYVLCSLAQFANEAGDFEAAAGHAAEALEMVDRLGAVQRGMAQGALTISLYSRGRPEEALPWAEKAVASYRSRGKAGRADTAMALSTLAGVHQALDQDDERERCLREALGLIKAAAGPRSAYTGDITTRLGGVLEEKGEYDEAGRLLEEALGILVEAYGATHPQVGRVLIAQSDLLRKTKQLEPALEKVQRAIEVARKQLGADHPVYVSWLTRRGRVEAELERFDDAERTYLAAERAALAKLGPRHFLTSRAVFSLARLHDRRDRSEQAVATFRRHLEHAPTNTPAFRRERAFSEFGIGKHLAVLDRPEEALPHLERAHADLVKIFGKDHERVLDVVRRLGDVLEALERPEDAARWRATLPPPDRVKNQ